MERYLDTQKIPKKGKGTYDWKNSVGCELYFQYDIYSGIIKIKDYIISDNHKYRLLIDIDGVEKEIYPHNLIRLEIGELIGGFTHDFKYNIGDTFGKENNKMKIISKYRNSGKMYHAQCLKCGYEKDVRESMITKGKGCPVCLNMIIIKGINDMWTTNSKLAELLANPEDGYKYSQHSSQKLIWICPTCNSKTKPLSPDYISRYGLHCPKCSDGFSYPNKFIFNLLTEAQIDFIPEKIFDWSNGRLYDFYLPQYNYIIEAHGMQHYESGGVFSKFSKLEDIQCNDIYKENIATNNGINKYIIIDCRYSNPNFIFKNIFQSELANIIDINKIDVKLIDKLCQKSIMSNVIDLYKKDYDTNKIAEYTKISLSHVCRILRKADSLGLIKYNKYKFKKENAQKRQTTLYQNHAKPIMCLENGCVFGSCTTASHNSIEVFGKNIKVSNICTALNHNKTTFGYRFLFISKEEFNNIKSQFPSKAFGDYFI